jgi:predicted membrane protein
LSTGICNRDLSIIGSAIALLYREALMLPLLNVVIALIVLGALVWLANTYVPSALGIRRIVNIVLALIVVGIFLWLIDAYIPMAGSIKTILNIVVVLATCVKVLQAVGVWSEVVRIWHNLTDHRAFR